MNARLVHGVTTPTYACSPTATQRLLLRAALLQGPCVLQAWQQWRAAVDLDRLDESSVTLLPALGRNLEFHRIGTPESRDFKWLHHRVWAANMRRLTAAAALLDELHRTRIDTILLKGAGLLLGTYADPGLRTMGDVDVLVREDRAVEAMQVLKRHGWRPVGWAPFCAAPEMTVPVRHSHAFSRNDGGHFDLHWHVLWETAGRGQDEDFWTEAIPVRVDGIETHVLSKTHQLLHVCVHGARWEKPVNLRWIADAMLLMREPSTIDWDRLVTAAIAHGVVLSLHDALLFLTHALDAPVPPCTLDALADVPVSIVERMHHFLARRPRGRLGALSLLACCQWRLARRGRGGLPGVGLPRYLTRMYEVRDVRDFRLLMAHGLRRRAPAG